MDFQKAATRLVHIDGLRALAAMLVVWQHVSESFASVSGKGIWVANMATTVDFGRIGVVIFFAISGFVIPTSLKYNANVKQELKKFIIRRFFRLYPVFWFSIPLGIITSWTIWGKHISIMDVLANLTMIPSYLGAPYIEGLYWTLEIELIFYGLCIALFIIKKLNSLNILSAISIILLGFFTYKMFGGDRSYLLVLHLAIMFWGAIFRQFYDNRKNTMSLIALAILPIICIIGFPCYSYYMVQINGLDIVSEIKFASAYAIAIFSFIIFAGIIKVKSLKLAWLGEISYSTYLLHPVFFYLLLRFVAKYPQLQNKHLLVYLIISFVLTIVVSSYTYKFIEKPAIQYAKRLTVNSG